MASLLYSLIISLSLLNGMLFLRSTKQSRTSRHFIFPYLTVSISGLILFFFILQLLFPQLLSLFQRDSRLILGGQIWRLVTSLFFQDGGTPGAVFNIVSLLLIGGLAEQHMKKSTWLILFFGGGILSQCIALFWQPIGAGNSVANFSLAGGIYLTVLLSGAKKLSLLSILGFGAALMLLFANNIHGAAVFFGAILFIFSRLP
jgi:membrane associated rhomboid family serine protease